MMTIQLLLLGTFILCSIPVVNSIICYQCTECPFPFTTNYPYVTTVNNTNFLAQCITTIVTFSDGSRLISKGSVFSCPSSSGTSDNQISCCGSDYCNSSVHFGPSILLFFFIFIIRIYL